MAYIGIMQGRLVRPEGGHFQSFPRLQWRQEFPLAARAGIETIEWIYDAYGEAVNPLATDSGMSEIQGLSQTTGVKVVSLCADYFMDHPFLRSSEMERTRLLTKAEWLLTRCKAAGITRMVLPFVDKSRIESAAEVKEVLTLLRQLLPHAELNGVELHLETALGPKEFAAFIAQCPHPFLRINYDSGNSSSLGYDVKEEFAAYGGHIGSVHIKDRRKGGGTVPLGTGDADLSAVFNGLASIPYTGDYILQVARAEPGNELPWIVENRAWVVNRIEAATKAQTGERA